MVDDGTAVAGQVTGGQIPKVMSTGLTSGAVPSDQWTLLLATPRQQRHVAMNRVLVARPVTIPGYSHKRKAKPASLQPASGPSMELAERGYPDSYAFLGSEAPSFTPPAPRAARRWRSLRFQLPHTQKRIQMAPNAAKAINRGSNSSMVLVSCHKRDMALSTNTPMMSFTARVTFLHSRVSIDITNSTDVIAASRTRNLTTEASSPPAVKVRC